MGGHGRRKEGRQWEGRERRGVRGERKEGSERGGQSEEEGKKERIPVILKVWPHITEDSLEQRMNLVFLRTSKHTVNKMG